MKALLTIAAALFLTACGADQATLNRDTLGTSQTVIVAAQKYVLDYRKRVPCSDFVLEGCRNASTYAEMQRLDRIATASNNAAYAEIQKNPGASYTKLAVEAAIANIKSFDAYTKEQR